VTLKIHQHDRSRMRKRFFAPAAVWRGGATAEQPRATADGVPPEAPGDDTPEPETKTDTGSENFQTQHLVLLCRDQSGTADQFRNRYMAGGQELCAEIKSDRMTAFSVRVAQVQFGGGRVEKSTFRQASEWSPEELNGWGGDTPLGRALDTSVDHILAEASRIRMAGAPVGKLMLIVETDGEATDGEWWDRALPKVHKAEREEKLLVFPIGIGNVVPAINRISCKRPAAVLKDDNIEGFYRWLAEVLGRVSRSRPGEEIELPPTDEWRRVKG
jgi:uncharacterized protein YegL